LVLEEPIEELVAGDHDGKPWARSTSRLARGSGSSIAIYGISMTLARHRYRAV